MPPAVRHAEKRRTSTCRFADRVAALSIQAYRQRIPLAYQAAQPYTCIATVVAHCAKHDHLQVVSLGVGTKFLSHATLQDETQLHTGYGTRVRDCHAEVLAVRAFRRYLLLEIQQIQCKQQLKLQNQQSTLQHQEQDVSSPSSTTTNVGKDMCLLELIPCTHGTNGMTTATQKYRLRHGITFHFYCSSAPCGNAVLKKFATMHKEVFRNDLCDSTWPCEAHDPMRLDSMHLGQGALLLKRDASPILHDATMNTTPTTGTDTDTPYSNTDTTMDVHLQVGDNFPTIKKQKRIQSRETALSCAPPGTVPVHSHQGVVHTCSDKMARWNVLGLQGSLLSSICFSCNHYSNTNNEDTDHDSTTRQKLQPLYLSTITVGRKFTEIICRRAVCCRLTVRAVKPRRSKAHSTCSILVPLYGLEEPYRIHHPTLMGTAVYMDETGTIDMSESSRSTGQDVRFHASECWAWWWGLETPECIDGSTGYVMSNGEDDTPSLISTAALVDLFLQVHPLSVTAPTSVEGLRSLKERNNKLHERVKRSLLTKHPVLRDWKQRSATRSQTLNNPI
jgi:hypothetical protein